MDLLLRHTVAQNLNAVDLHVRATGACLESLSDSLLTGVQEFDCVLLSHLAIHVVVCGGDSAGGECPAYLSLELSVRLPIFFFLFLEPAQADRLLLEQCKCTSCVSCA